MESKPRWRYVPSPTSCARSPELTVTKHPAFDNLQLGLIKPRSLQRLGNFE
ncbi:hypothetical protein [Scytonema sp. PCC 10023]|uniref:hypothetical protein n=1 Tax=Scytonema sp. PCC 10023 TaxID=1680591 RepID=UPI0039C6A5F4